MSSYYVDIYASPFMPSRKDCGKIEPLDFDIAFERPEGRKSIEEAENFHNDIEQTLRFLKRYYRRKPCDFLDNFDLLIKAARNGLLGGLNIKGGRNDLKRINNTLIDEARKERDDFILRTVVNCIPVLMVGVLLFLIGLGIEYFFFHDCPVTSARWTTVLSPVNLAHWTKVFGLMHMGIAIGIPFSALLANQVTSIDQLLSGHDPHGYRPTIRILYIVLASWLLLLTMATDVVIIGLIESFNDLIKEKALIGMVIGVLCAVTPDVVSALLVSRLRASIKNDPSTA